MRKRIYENKFHPKENKGLSIILFIFALILSWLIFLIPFLPPIIFLFWLVVLITLWNKKTKLKWYLLCFSGWTLIPILSFSIGIFSYFTGNATFGSYGLTGPESDNLERERRIWPSNSGCLVSGLEFLSQDPNNLIVILLYDLFGVQKGVYKGYYPDQNESKKNLR